MATPKKLPSGNWNILVFSHVDENGKRKYVSFTAPTKTEVNRLAAEFQDNRTKDSRPQDIIISDVISKYIQSKEDVWSPKTLREHEGYIKYYKPIGNIKLGSLDKQDLQNFVNDLSTHLAPKTVRNIYGLLISAIRMFSDRNFNVTLPPKAVVERNIPTDKEVSLLISKANPTLKLAIILGSQGLRRGEIASLKYKDILRDFNAIYIHSDMVLDKHGNWVYKAIPKTQASVRRVVLSKEIIDMLGEGDDEDYIIGVKPSTITSDFINLRNKLGLKCRFHDLRHYSASILHAIGVPDVYIQERNGLGSDKVLKEIYRNTLSDRSAHFSAIANDYFSKAVLNTDVEANQT